MIAIELGEDGADTGLRVVVALAVRLAEQVVDGYDDLLHLLLVDLAVLVRVVHLEGQVELLAHVAVRRHRDGDEEFGEVDLARVVGVEYLEYLCAELLRFALWVELFVDFGEFL